MGSDPVSISVRTPATGPPAAPVVNHHAASQIVNAVDAAVEQAGLDAGPCRTARLPLVGAAPRRVLATVPAPRRLVERYGTEATTVLALAEEDPELLRPVAPGVEVTGAELLFAARYEGALDVDDLLDRRTRVGLVPADVVITAVIEARVLAT